MTTKTPCCKQVALLKAVRAMPDDASAAALLEHIPLRSGVTPQAAAKAIRGMKEDGPTPPSDADISEFLNIFADFKVEGEEWFRLLGLAKRNWKWISVTISLIVGTVGGWWYANRPVVPNDHDDTAIVKALGDLGTKQDAGFKSLLDAIKAEPPKPVPPIPTPTPAQPISVEDRIECNIGKPVKLPIKAASPLTYLVLPPERAGEVDADDTFIRVTAQSDGVYWIVATCVSNGKVAQRTIEVKAGKGPLPPPEPKPPVEPPILGDGFRVMVILETGKTLPLKIHSAVYGEELRAYLFAKCAPTSDGARRGFYITDKDQDFSKESKVWQSALSRPRASVPWVIVSAPGKGSFEGPVTEDLFNVVKKYGG